MRFIYVISFIYVIATSTYAQIEKTKLQLRFNPSYNKYDVYLYVESGSPINTPQTIQTGAQVSIVAPVGTKLKNIVSFNPINSSDPSKKFNWSGIVFQRDFPKVDPQYSFFAFNAAISFGFRYFNIQEGDYIKLFSFEVEGLKNCGKDIRLWNNHLDPQPFDGNMDGQDFNIGFTLGGSISSYQGNLPIAFPQGVFIENIDVVSAADSFIIKTNYDISSNDSIRNSEWLWGIDNAAYNVDSLAFNFPPEVMIYSTESLWECRDTIIYRTTYSPVADFNTCSGEEVILIGSTFFFNYEENINNPEGLSIVLEPNFARLTFNDSAEGDYIVHCDQCPPQGVTISVSKPESASIVPSVICLGKDALGITSAEGTWRVLNNSGLTVDSNSVFIGEALGLYSCKFFPTVGCPSKIVEVSVNSLEDQVDTTVQILFLGDSLKLNFNTDFKLTSSNLSVVTISQNNELFGKSVGTILLTIEDPISGCRASKIIRVIQRYPTKIRGRVFLDADNDEVFTQGLDIPLQNAKIELLQLGLTYYSDPAGFFDAYAPSAIQELRISVPYGLWDSTYVFRSARALSDDLIRVYAGFRSLGSFGNPTFTTSISRLRCDSVAYISPVISNGGTSNFTGKLYIDVSRKSRILEASAGGIIFDNYTKNVVSVENLPAGATLMPKCKIWVGNPAIVGPELEFSLYLVNKEGDTVYQESIRETIRCSFDPNDKDSWPSNHRGGELQRGDFITYQVRFQNTGNDAAYAVVVIDTIDIKALDISTLQILGASHSGKFSLNKNVLIARFDPILLPSAMEDDEKSQGFVLFKIRPYLDIELSTIRNKAQIYFDNNPPIYTNEDSISIFGPKIDGLDTVVHWVCQESNIPAVSVIQSPTYQEKGLILVNHIYLFGNHSELTFRPIYNGLMLIGDELSEMLLTNCQGEIVSSIGTAQTVEITEDGYYKIQYLSKGCPFETSCFWYQNDQSGNSNNDIIIYPNPAANYLTISGVGRNAIIEIIDGLGRVMLTAKNESRIAVDVLSNGHYLLKIFEDNLVYYENLTILR